MGINIYPPQAQQVSFNGNQQPVYFLSTQGVNIQNKPNINTIRNITNGVEDKAYSANINQSATIENFANGVISAIYTSVYSALKIRVSKIFLQIADTQSHDGGNIVLRWRNSAGTSTVDIARYFLEVNKPLILDFDNCSLISPYTGGRLEVLSQTGETYSFLNAHVFASEV